MMKKSLMVGIWAVCGLFPSVVLGQEFALQTGWPDVNGQIRAMVLDTVTEVLYVGGSFTEVNGSPRIGLAAFDTGTGTVLPWSPSANGGVFAMAIHDGTLYIGGNFTELAGAPRGRLGAFDLATGQLKTWAPTVNAVVNSMLASADAVHVAGDLTQANGVTRNRVTAFHPISGDLLPWNPNVAGFVRTLIRDGSSILIGGTFTLVGGQARAMLAEVDDSMGALLPWNPAPNGGVASLLLHNGTVYCAGNFTSIGGAPRSSLAAIDRITGIPTSWAPSVTGAVNQMHIWNNELIIGGFLTQVEGLSNQHLASYSVVTGAFNTPPPSPSSTIYTMVVSGDALYIGGVFTLINPNTPRLRFAAWSLCQPTPWFTDADGDGLGDPNISQMSCTAPVGTVNNANDCDDSNELIGAPTTWYFDGDEDGHGDPLTTVLACSQPPGYVLLASDCDDANAEIQPNGPCDDGDPYSVADVLSGYPTCGCAGQTILVAAHVVLQGPYDPGTGLMSDDLRIAGLLPLSEPYTALGYDMVGLPMAGGDVIEPSVLTVTGPDAIVDWVILELREAISGTEPLAIRCALLQRDGDIVDVDGVSPVRMALTYGSYQLGVLHRNHIGVVTNSANGIYFEATAIDLSAPDVVMFGSVPRAPQGAIMLLRAGDTSFNDEVIYVGQDNDRDPILSFIGGSLPTGTATGYRLEDINMDGVIKYTGGGNDRDFILQTVGGTVPTNSRPHVFRRPTY